jgi:hypothetical protein
MVNVSEGGLSIHDLHVTRISPAKSSKIDQPNFFLRPSCKSHHLKEVSFKHKGLQIDTGLQNYDVLERTPLHWGSKRCPII